MPAIDIHSPLREAVRQLAGRKVTPSGMTSREWEALQAEIRLRSFFSSRVEEERVLAEMKERIDAGIANLNRDGATMDRSRFVEEMRTIIRETGYKRPDGVDKKSVRNLKSRARLELIWNMNVSQARGFAKWKADMTPEGLANEPCYELVRVMRRREIRDWPLVWEDHGGKFYGAPGKDYPLAKGRMIAKKTDPIWRWISRFKTPWPPFDWGSGMGLAGISRSQAEALGVVKPEDDPQVPLAVPFNAGHRMSLKDVPESGRERLRSDFGDAIRIDNDEVKLQRETSPETDEQRNQDIPQSLRQRARSQYLQASEELQRRLQQSDDGTEVGFRGKGESEVADIYLAQAAAVSVGRKRLFHDTMTQAEAETFLQAVAGFPPAAAAHYDPAGGHMLMWRRDLLDHGADFLLREIQNGGGGLLLGYGLETPAFGTAHVLVRIFRAPRLEGDSPVCGFHAPLPTWRVYAAARARDISDAWQIDTITEWEVRP